MVCYRYLYVHFVYLSDPVVHSCCHHSRSYQSLQGCSSWLGCTWPQQSWWRGQTLPPDLLPIEKFKVTIKFVYLFLWLSVCGGCECAVRWISVPFFFFGSSDIGHCNNSLIFCLSVTQRGGIKLPKTNKPETNKSTQLRNTFRPSLKNSPRLPFRAKISA